MQLFNTQFLQLFSPNYFVKRQFPVFISFKITIQRDDIPHNQFSHGYLIYCYKIFVLKISVFYFFSAHIYALLVAHSASLYGWRSIASIIPNPASWSSSIISSVEKKNKSMSTSISPAFSKCSILFPT